jgi:copper homeostasis protein (lipoprotein)
MAYSWLRWIGCPSGPRLKSVAAPAADHILQPVGAARAGAADGTPTMLKAHGMIAMTLVTCAVLPACKATDSAEAMQSPPSAAIGSQGLRLPATFLGNLPCSDCQSVRWHLDLWADQGYQLRREWVGRDLDRDEVGRWRVDPGRNVLVLYGASEMPLQFEILAPDRLRLLDTLNQSQSPQELVSDGTFSPANVTLTLGGEMTYMADAASFTECMTGRSYPIAFEGDFVKLERAYLAAASEPGARLYVTFDGSIVDRPRMEGEGTERTVVVNRYINVWPDQRCERAMAHAALSNTYWRVVRLGDAPVAAAEGRREPHLVLREADGRSSYSATVGCNQLAGSYSVDGRIIHFSPAATTLLPCPPPLDALERTLGMALSKAARWSISASTLELLDAAGQPIALFEAVYLR